jgi:hypothetical protein
MTRNHPWRFLGVVLGLLVAGASHAAVVIDGVLDADYGAPVSIQTTTTDFGDNTLGQPGFANGSELDLAYGVIQGDKLFLFLAGNLESNFNKLEIFIDAIEDGQNRLRGDNPNVDFNGLNRMGDDGSGNGLTFESGIAFDHWIGLTGGGDPYQLYANFAQLRSAGGGVGRYLGQTGAESNGALTGGDNPDAIRIAISNRNVAGVVSGCATGSGTGVTRGVELAIPLGAIGSPTSFIRVCAFLNGGGHDFVSNQVLGPLVGNCNLGEPRNVKFASIPHDQYFAVARSSSVPGLGSFGTAAAGMLLVGIGIVALRRRRLAAA